MLTDFAVSDRNLVKSSCVFFCCRIAFFNVPAGSCMILLIQKHRHIAIGVYILGSHSRTFA